MFGWNSWLVGWLVTSLVVSHGAVSPTSWDCIAVPWAWLSSGGLESSPPRTQCEFGGQQSCVTILQSHLYYLLEVTIWEGSRGGHVNWIWRCGLVWSTIAGMRWGWALSQYDDQWWWLWWSSLIYLHVPKYCFCNDSIYSGLLIKTKH